MGVLLVQSLISARMKSYGIGHAARFDGSTGELSWVPENAGNTKVHTISLWVHRLDVNYGLLFVASPQSDPWNNADRSSIEYPTTTGTLRFTHSDSTYRNETSALYRDTLAWAHVVLYVDTPSADWRLYINGKQVIDFDVANAIASNTNLYFCDAVRHNIGGVTGGSANGFSNMMVADVYMIDGQALGPESFAKTDPKTGNWIAKKYTGSYGTNGFHLDFSKTATHAASYGITPTSSAGTVGGALSGLSNENYADDWYSDVDPATTVSNGWVRYDLTTAQAITHVALTARPGGVSTTTGNWKVQYSDNDVDWTDTGTTFSSVSLVSNTTRGAILDISGDGAGSHRYWRAVNISNSVGASRWGFAEIEMFTSAGDLYGLGADGAGSNHWVENGTITQVSSTPTNRFCHYLGELQAPDGAYYAYKPTFTFGNTCAQGNVGSSWLDAVGDMLIPEQDFYYEAQCEAVGTNAMIGIQDARNCGGYLVGNQPIPCCYLQNNGTLYSSTTDGTPSSSASWSGTFTTGDVVRVSGTWTGSGWQIKFAKNAGDTWCDGAGAFNSTFASAAVAATLPVGNNGGGYVIHTTPYGSSTIWNLNTGDNGTFNGQKTAGGNADAKGLGDFFGAVPTGALSLCTDNLPAQTGKLSDHMVSFTYTGDDTTSRSITDGATTWTPGFVNLKCRSHAEDWIMHDAARGVSDGRLRTNTTDIPETTSDRVISAFEVGGFTGPTTTPVNINVLNRTYVATMFNLPSSETNTDGDISVDWIFNSTLGVAVGKYTASGVSGTVGLPTINGKAPAMVITKSLSAVDSWYVIHKGFSSVGYVKLEDAGAFVSSAHPWNGAFPTASAVSLSSAAVTSGGHILICFWETDFCKIGSFQGNSSADGSFANLGGACEFMLCKATGSGTSWPIFDGGRWPDNPHSGTLFADTSAVENTDVDCDLFSNGWKARRSSTNFNAVGSTYVYLAFVQPDGAIENPAR